MTKYFAALICFASLAYGHDISNLSIGFQSGYGHFSSFQAVPIRDAFPLSANLNYLWTHHIQTKLEYQWIRTEHAGQGSANFQTLRLIPNYVCAKLDDHQLGIESGLGYQYAGLSGIDTIRQMEWLIGPTWAWNFSQSWGVTANVRYVRSFDSFPSSSFQHVDIGFGISYTFGQHTQYELKYFSDSDQDGVPNNLDECSKTPFGIKVFRNGCPLDQDGDFIADYQDFCPNTEKESEVDEMGCPLSNPGRGVIDGVAFENESPRMTDTSKIALATVAENLKKYPNLLFVIEGYTSPIGSPTQRTSISKARAISVLNLLVSYGVPAEKLQAVGLGDQYPLTESTDERDRILNERIEIKWKKR